MTTSYAKNSRDVVLNGPANADSKLVKHINSIARRAVQTSESPEGVGGVLVYPLFSFEEIATSDEMVEVQSQKMPKRLAHEQTALEYIPPTIEVTTNGNTRELLFNHRGLHAVFPSGLAEYEGSGLQDSRMKIGTRYIAWLPRPNARHPELKSKKEKNEGVIIRFRVDQVPDGDEIYVLEVITVRHDTVVAAVYATAVPAAQGIPTNFELVTGKIYSKATYKRGNKAPFERRHIQEKECNIYEGINADKEESAVMFTFKTDCYVVESLHKISGYQTTHNHEADKLLFQFPNKKQVVVPVHLPFYNTGTAINWLADMVMYKPPELMQTIYESTVSDQIDIEATITGAHYVGT